ncbi:MAG: NUDIX hydrolase [Chlamydiae bacterium]|nr:NUDIX hydrolase [Chlamydiota bacterium]
MKKMLSGICMLLSIQGSSLFGALYEKVPEDFTPHVEVAACYCQFENTILLLQYGADKKYSGKWALPAGKMEAGETPLDCVVREVLEETGIVLDKAKVQTANTVFIRDLENVDFVFHMFVYKLSEKPMIKISEEHLRYEWVNIREALTYPLVPDERECIELVYKDDLHNRNL